jgi:hypothetical protein
VVWKSSELAATSSAPAAAADVLTAGMVPVLAVRTAATGRATSATPATDQRRRGLANRCLPTHGTLPGLFCGDGIVRYLLSGSEASNKS